MSSTMASSSGPVGSPSTRVRRVCSSSGPELEGAPSVDTNAASVPTSAHSLLARDRDITILPTSLARPRGESRHLDRNQIRDSPHYPVLHITSLREQDIQ